MCIPNRGKESKLTHERLTELLHYNPETGVFTWQVKRQGIQAGCVDKHGYIRIGIDRIHHLAHRLAWLYVHREWPEVIDHINRDRADNRIVNLRSISPSENSKNTKIHCNNKSGYLGVNLHKGSGKWVAHIGLQGVRKQIGFFSNIDDAIKARKAAEREHGFHPNHGNIKPIVSLAVAV